MLGIFLDTETTGLSADSAKILSLAFRVIDLVTGEELGSFSTHIKHPKKVWDDAHPRALEVNGMSWKKDGHKGKNQKETMKLVTAKLFALIKDRKSCFICQNPSFDKSFFNKLIPNDIQRRYKLPYHWLDLASMFLMHSIKSGTLSNVKSLSKDNIAKALGLVKEDDIHTAMGGVDRLILCFNKLKEVIS